MMEIDDLLSRERPKIEEILALARCPGLSLGVLQNGEVVHEAHFGFRDVERATRADSDTRYNINSLTKAIIAAGCNVLIQKDQLKWDSRLSDFFPEFAREPLESWITVADLLSHRSGFNTPTSLWIQDHNIVLLDKDDAIPVFLKYSKGAHRRFRASCIYNNYAYSIVGLLIEKISGQQLGDFLDDCVFAPLGMTRTTTSLLPVGDPNENTARSYAVLADGSWYEISLAQYLGRDTLMEAAGGVKSCLKDLLLFYSQIMKEEHLGPAEDTNYFGDAVRDNKYPPLKNARQMIEPRSFFDTTSVREETYALGWIRTELPAQLGKLGVNAKLIDRLPLIGEHSPSTLCVYHEGLQPGSMTSVYTFPESNIAILALQNSSSSCDCADWIAQLCIQTIFDYPSRIDFVQLAKEGIVKFMDFMPNILRELESRRTTGTQPSLPLDDYIGHYYDPSGRFFIDIRASDTKDQASPDTSTRSLELAFQGLDSQVHSLEHYEHDTFSWALTHDEASRSGRLMVAYGAGYYLLEFVVEGEHGVTGLRWRINTGAENEPVLFVRSRLTPGQFETTGVAINGRTEFTSSGRDAGLIRARY